MKQQLGEGEELRITLGGQAPKPSASNIPAPVHTNTLWRDSLSTTQGKCSSSFDNVDAGWRDTGVTQNICERG